MVQVAVQAYPMSATLSFGGRSRYYMNKTMINPNRRISDYWGFKKSYAIFSKNLFFFVEKSLWFNYQP